MRQTVRANRVECTGCGACVSICPTGAITMRPDKEGFLYPAVDGEKCISCDLCEKRCPVGAVHEAHAVQTMGAQHKNTQVREHSSSGGIFSALAHDVLAQGGVVFGAAFDDHLHVEHVGAMDASELAGMRGSKYVQSDATEAIRNAAALCSRGIPVLFSGTPCQIDGLLAKVRGKEREKLLTVDFVCHGVPSPGVFASYLAELERKHGQHVTAYAFRDKRLGWKNFSAVATLEDGSEVTGTQTDEPFLYGFLQNLYLRPACGQCTQLRGNRHPADITLADLWGAQQICPQRDDDTGLSLVMINTPKGQHAIRRVKQQLTTFSVKTDKLLRFNPGIEETAKMHPKREAFFRGYARHGFEADRVMKLLAPPGTVERIAKRIAHLPAGALRRVRAVLSK